MRSAVGVSSGVSVPVTSLVVACITTLFWLGSLPGVYLFCVLHVANKALVALTKQGRQTSVACQIYVAACGVMRTGHDTAVWTGLYCSTTAVGLDCGSIMITPSTCASARTVKTNACLLLLHNTN